MRRFVHTFFGMAAVFAASAAGFSCADDMYDNSLDEPLKLSVETIQVDLKAQTATIGVTARDGSWSTTGAEAWLTLSPASGNTGTTQVTVSFAPNDGEDSTSRNAVITFTSGSTTKIVSVEQLNTGIVLPNMNADYPVNQAVHELLKEWYYNGEPGSAGDAADFNQSYDDFYFNYLSHLKRNEDFEGNIWAKDSERYIYSYIERNPAGTDGSTTPPLNYGMEFDLVEFDGRLVGRILYVEKNSPADVAGLQRGDWFDKVNGTRLGNWETTFGDFKYHYNRFIDTLVHPIAGVSPRLGMLSFNGSQHTFSDQGRSVTLSPANFPNNPILGTQTFRVEKLPAGSGESVNVGYMMYNSFDPKYENELVAAFREFKKGYGGEPLDNFILDLRYNKNGTVEMAQLLGNLLAGNIEGVAGRKFAEYRFNDESRNRTATFEAHPDGIEADTLFVLTSPHTAGASELLINALRGLDQSVVKLVVTGAVTQGLAAGMVKRTVDNLSPGWEYSAWMLAFRCRNDHGDGDYMYGLVPNGGEVDEWQCTGDNLKWSTVWGWKGQPGSTEDTLVKRAVDMIIGRLTIPTGDVVNSARHNRAGLPRKFCFPTNMVMAIE